MGTGRQAARISWIAAISSFIACDRAVVGYGRSKTANILFAVEFDRCLRAAGVRATAVHPGGIATELGRYAYSAPRAPRSLLVTSHGTLFTPAPRW